MLITMLSSAENQMTPTAVINVMLQVLDMEKVVVLTRVGF